MMNTLKTIQYRFPHSSSPHLQQERSNGRRRSIIFLSNSEIPDSNSSNPEGDKRKQELLAEIVTLQAQKIRLTDFLDDRSAYLSQLAEEAIDEFDAIGENALKELDDAGARILEKLESRIQGFEESAEKNKQEIELSEKTLAEFEEQIVRDRNEGLFFKNLKPEAPQKKAVIMAETQKLKQVAKESAGSRTRINVYIALISLMILAVGNAVVGSPEVEWRKVGALSLILVGLLAQFIYEQSMSSTTDETNKEK